MKRLTIIQVQKWNHTDTTINNSIVEIQQISAFPEIREIKHSWAITDNIGMICIWPREQLIQVLPANVQF